MKKPTYISNGYVLFSENESGYSGVVVGNTVELRHHDSVVDSVTIDDYDPTIFNNIARQMYDDMLEYALSQEN